MEPAAKLAEGRESYARQAWSEAYESLSEVDRSSPLGPADLELLANSAYMLGREREYQELMERAYGQLLEGEQRPAALRCAFWLGLSLTISGEIARGNGWFGRADRLLDPEGIDSVERGYVTLSRLFEHEAEGEVERAAEVSADAAAIGERFGDPDLVAFGSFTQGDALIRLGRLREGLALLDLAMVAVLAGEVSPVSSGIVYCGVILACEQAHDIRRAREWTTALSEWWKAQPDLVAFTGRCLVHRAQIMRLDGSWEESIEEARRAAERCLQGENPVAAGEAHYQRGEVHRLRGERDAAEEAYREASAHGWEPQPGLALLRLAQGNEKAAEAAMRRAVSEAKAPGRRATLLSAHVEVMAAAGDLGEAERACVELEALAGAEEKPGALRAMAAQARGAIELAAGRPRDSLASLRRADQIWQEFGAPYESARARELIGLACRDLGDQDSAELELQAARATFERLGAATDLARIEGPAELARASHELTDREVEVLRLLSTGETNREIAAELVLSVRTVDRHVSNIYAKLGVSSRVAAASYAHEHGLGRPATG